MNISFSETFKKVTSVALIFGLVFSTLTPAAFAAVSINNGNFSNVSGMTNAGGGWYHGTPPSWSISGTGNYVVHNGVLNLAHSPAVQSIGAVAVGGELITVSFDYGDRWNGGYYAANEDMLRVELWDTTANTLLASKTVKNTGAYGTMVSSSLANTTAATAGNMVEIRFISLTGTGVTPGNAAALDNVSISTADGVAPVITLNGSTPVTVEVGSVYTDAGAIASDNLDGDKTANIIVVNPVNSNVPGTYTVTYNVSDVAGNAATQVTRTVNVVDTTKPVISLIGSPTVSVNFGASYTDAGATASDNVDGNITGSIVTVNPVNTGSIGTYSVTYDVSDVAGNAATQVVRTVNVVDVTAPVINITGDNPMTIEVGGSYTELGANAVDDVDGTFAATASGSVDTNTVGTYTINYNATDSSSNAATQVVRTVNVVDTTAPVLTLLGITPADAEWTQVYIDAGATASDNVDGDITGDIITVNPVNTLVIGVYTITYNVTDNAGNDAAEITRTVNVVDTIAPIQTSVVVTPLNGSVSVKLNTQENATVTLSYGFTSTYGSSADVTTVANMSHDKTILGLSPCSDYHYSIVATDIHGNVSSSSDGEFTTLGVGSCPGDPNSGGSSQGGSPSFGNTTQGDTSTAGSGNNETPANTSNETTQAPSENTGTTSTTNPDVAPTPESSPTTPTSEATPTTPTNSENTETPVNNTPSAEPAPTPTQPTAPVTGSGTGGTTGGTPGPAFNPADATLDQGGGTTPDNTETVVETPTPETTTDIGGGVAVEESSYTLLWTLLGLIALLNTWWFFVAKNKPDVIRRD